MARFLILIGCAASLFASPLAAAQPQQAKPVSRSDFIKNIDSRFNAADTNHDGKLSRDEVIAAQQRDLQQTKQKVIQTMEAKFRQLDTNHDGQLSLQEFLAAAPQLRPTQTPDQVLQQLDTNHDGKISVDEFRAPDVAKFNKLDANHDGVVSPAEMQAAQQHK